MGTAEVAVTGVGMITPLGISAQATMTAWRGGASALKTRVAELAGTAYADAEVAVLPPVCPDGRIRNKRLLKYTSGAGLLACLAAAEAAHDAAIATRFAPHRVGLFAGSSTTSADLAEALSMITRSLDQDGRFSAALLGSRGLSATNPLMAFRILPNMAPCLISMNELIKGPSLIFTPWEGQTAAAIIEAWQAVATGEVDCALAGGSDEPSNPAALVFLRHGGKLRRDEFAAAAAAYVVLERLDSARKDGHRVYCRIGRMSLAMTDSPVTDPLAIRIGRTFAAAPAVLFALACLDHKIEARMSGADGQEFRAQLEPEA